MIDIDELIEYLQGTCMSLDEGISDLYPDLDSFNMTEEDHTHLALELFKCECCGWWFETCTECQETEDCGGGFCGDCCPNENDHE